MTEWKDIAKNNSLIIYLIFATIGTIVISIVMAFPILFFEHTSPNPGISNINNAIYFTSTILFGVQDTDIKVNSEYSKIIVVFLGIVSIFFSAIVTTVFLTFIVKRIDWEQFKKENKIIFKKFGL